MVQVCNNMNGRAVRACFIERQAKGNCIQNAKQQQTPSMKSWERSRKDGALWARETQYPGCTVYPFERRRIRGMAHRKPRSNLMCSDFYSDIKAGCLSADFLCAQVKDLFFWVAPWSFDGRSLVTEDGAGHVQVTSICGAFV